MRRPHNRGPAPAVAESGPHESDRLGGTINETTSIAAPEAQHRSPDDGGAALANLRSWSQGQSPGGKKQQRSRALDRRLDAMRRGERLCCQHDKTGTTYWLEPSRSAVPRTIARRITSNKNVTALFDGLFGDDPQTWQWNGGVR
jgi:hypothetical protein